MTLPLSFILEEISPSLELPYQLLYYSPGHLSPAILDSNYLCTCLITLTSLYCLDLCSSVQFSSVPQLCLTLCEPIDCSMPGLPVHYRLLEFTQAHVHWVRDAIQTSHSLLSPSSPAFNLSQHQGLFQWASSSHQVAKELEFQLQHRCFQSIFRTDFL